MDIWRYANSQKYWSKPNFQNTAPTGFQVRLSFRIRGNNVTLFEERPAFRYPSNWVTISIAQFRFDEDTNKWTLYYGDRNARWHLYNRVKPCADFFNLLKEVDRDPTDIFWG
jgi:hypothetical protein